MNTPALSAASRSPGRALDVAILLTWLSTYIAARAVIPSVPHGSALAVGAALLPVIPTVAVLWRARLAAASLDELHRRVHLEALATAFGLAIVMLWTLGLLELAISLNRDDWSYRHVWALLPMFYFIGLAFTWRRYK